MFLDLVSNMVNTIDITHITPPKLFGVVSNFKNMKIKISPIFETALCYV